MPCPAEPPRCPDNIKPTCSRRLLDLPRVPRGLFLLLQNHYKTNDKSTISSSQNPWWSSICSIMLIKPLKYQSFQDQISPNSKLSIQVLFWKQSKTHEITTFLRLSSPWIIMCYHIFSCLAPRSLQDAPITSNLHVPAASWICLEFLMASSYCFRIIIKPMTNQPFLVHRIHGDQAFVP